MEFKFDEVIPRSATSFIRAYKSGETSEEISSFSRLVKFEILKHLELNLEFDEINQDARRLIGTCGFLVGPSKQQILKM